MKKMIMPLLLLIITAVWLFLTTRHYHGLNSLQGLSAYSDGVLRTRALAQPPRATLYSAPGAASIDIDTLGIPHIFGKDLNAAGYALGYMHARDRYFQMELLAHTVMGELSTIIGSDGLGSDQNWKRFDLEARAKSMMENIAKSDPQLFAYLDAYARGVNAYVAAEQPSERDPMYLIWNYSPRPWKPYYPFLIQWYMSFDLGFYDDYVDRQELLEKLPAAVRSVLYPDELNGMPFIIPSPSSTRLAGSAASGVTAFAAGKRNTYAARETDKSLGSNNWVIGGGKTAAGQSFLCNDLHLFLTRPNIFYEVQMESPVFHAYGYTIPGVPAILSGHNERIAWGITNGGWDVTEQYLLKTDPKNNRRYQLDGKWVDMESRHFPIAVKGEGTVDCMVDYTVFGPVVWKDHLTYALKWHPAQSCFALKAFFQLMKAGRWSDFREALRTYDYPAQNFAYADVDGNIGMICAGRMPVKPQNYSGGLLDGTVSPQWRYLDFDSLPQLFNPAPQYLFSANQQPQKGGSYFSARWADDLSRPRRINELLLQNHKFSLDDMRQMQLDVVDISGRDLSLLLKKYAQPGQLARHWSWLLDWDDALTPHGDASLLYRTFREVSFHYCRGLADRFGIHAAPSYDQFMNFLVHNDSLTWNGQTFYARQCFADLVKGTDSLYAARTSMPQAYTPYTFAIPNMTMLPGFDTYVDQMGGSENTINVNYSAHSVIRTVIEIRDGAIHSWMVNAVGQTGRMNDPEFSRQLSSWVGNFLHPTQFVADEGQLRSIASRIQLVTSKN